MIQYVAVIGADNIAFLLNGPLHVANLLDHVESEEATVAGGWDADTIVFDEAVRAFLRGLPEDHDGCIDGVDQMWFEGDPYEVSTVDRDAAADQLDAWEANRGAYDTEGDEQLEFADEGGNT